MLTLILIFVVVVVAVACTTRLSRVEDQLEELRRKSEWLENELKRNRSTAPIHEQEQAEGSVAQLLAQERARPAEPPPIILQPEHSTTSFPAGSGWADLPPPAPPQPEPLFETYPAEEPVHKAPSEPFKLEQFLGAKLFAWVGGIALFFGVAFFIKYSFDRNLIPPGMRVLLGAATGIGLIVGGIRLRHRPLFHATAHTLCASGILILYAAAFGAYQLYSLITLRDAFGLMSLITAGAFIMSVKFDSKPAAVLALLGGFLTPLLLRSGEVNAPGLFSYLAVLNVGIIAVALNRGWQSLPMLGGLFTMLFLAGWTLSERSSSAFGLGVHLGFVALFAAGVWLAKRLGKLEDRWIGGVAFVATAAFWFAYSSSKGYRAEQHAPALYAFLLAVDALLLTTALAHPGGRLLFAGGGGALFILLPIIFKEVPRDGPLWPTLAAFLCYGILHAIVPSLLQKRGREILPPRAAEGFAIMALAMCFMPLASTTVGAGFWLAVLLLNAIVVAVAFMISSVALLVAGLAATVGLALFWVLRAPMGAKPPGLMLLVVGLIGLFYWTIINAARGSMPFFKPGRQMVSDADTPLEKFTGPLSILLSIGLLGMVLNRFHLPNPSAVFGVGLALILCAFAASRWTRSYEAVPLFGVGFLLLEAFWVQKHFWELPLPIAFAWMTGISIVFLGHALLFVPPSNGALPAWAAGGAAFPAHFLLLYLLMSRRANFEWPGLVALAMALPNVLGVWRAARLMEPSDPARPACLAWMGGGAIFLLSVAIPVQFERQWITLAWSIEAVGLLMFARWARHPGLLKTATALLVIVFIRLALNPAIFRYEFGTGFPIFNWHQYTYGIAIGSMIAAVKLWGQLADLLPKFNPRPAFWAFAGILGFIMINVQIADFFADTRTLTFNFRRSLATGMTYSIAWGLYALALIAVGIWRRVAPCRYAGMALIAVTTLKLFLLDLQMLDAIYRIVAFIAVAVILIAASMLYQRFMTVRQP